MDESKWDEMKADLMAKTAKELRAIAKAEGIVLGNEAARKESTAAAIVTWRRNAELMGYE